MTQTIGAKSMRNVDVHYTSTSPAIWNEISGVLNAVEVSGGDRITGEAYTADGDTAIVLFGKREPIDVTGRIVYSEITTEPWVVLEALYKAGTDIRLSWAPGGWATDNLLFRTGTVNITSCGYPGGDVESGDPILVEFAVKTAAISYAAMTTASGTWAW
jgi:hypothetical protein